MYTQHILNMRNNIIIFAMFFYCYWLHEVILVFVCCALWRITITSEVD